MDEKMEGLTENTILTELYRIGVALLSAGRLEDVLDTLLAEALNTMKAPAGSVALYDKESDSLTIKALRGFSKDFSLVPHWKRKSGGMTDAVLNKKTPLVVSNMEKFPFIVNDLLVREGVKSVIATPLYADDRVIGILYIDDFSNRPWQRREVKFLTLLGIQAAYAIEKFRLIGAISEAKAYLKNVLDDSADIIITTNTKNEIVEFNSSAARKLGYTKQEAAGMEVAELWLNPRERQEVMKILRQNGYVTNYETKLKTKQGGIIDVSLTLSLLKSGDGEVLGTVGISKDITEKKRLEKAVEERTLELLAMNEKLEDKVYERTRDIELANQKLERSNKLKSRFIATISHELRTPLNSILGFSELLLDEVSGPLTERQKRQVNNIYSSGTHLLQLINNVLDIAKIESGKVELHNESFLVKDAVIEVEGVIRSLADKKNQVVKIKSDGIPFIVADRIKFKQILYNLLSNAVKFTPDGGTITIEAGIITAAGLPLQARNLAASPEKNSFLRLSVADTGIGIKNEDLDRVFADFEQGDNSLSRRYEGTGLGLALTKRLVELHDGEIFVESTEGEGCKFTLIIPIVDTTEVEETVPLQAGTETETFIRDELDPSKRRGDPPFILVVEDDLSTSEILTLYLAQGGYRIAHAYNGDETLRRMREVKPFTVLLDVMLPGKDGWEVLQEIKSDPELKEVPVIICSARDNKELGFALGASDYLVKPVDKKSLLMKLDELSSCVNKRKGQMTVLLCIDEHDDTVNLLESFLEPAQYTVITACSGQQGIEMAVKHVPDFIVLDLMVSQTDGFEVMQALKSNVATADIPILAVTSKDLTVHERLALMGKVEKYIRNNNFTKEDLLMHIRDLEVTYPARAGLVDEVSGLFDNCYYHLRLQQEIGRTSRFNGTFSALVLDLDNFTEYIRAHGIRRANICIRKIAEFLRKSLRGSDVIARYGIDEFASMLANTPKSGAEIVAKRLLTYIESYPFYGEEVMPQRKVTASIAIIDYPNDASSPDTIILKARQLLRRAKANGGGRIESY